MAAIYPFRGLRYQLPPERMGEVIAPPYDVISPAQQQALYDRGPHNIVRVEYPQETGPQRYQVAASTLGQMRSSGVLTAEGRPALYRYRQRFIHEGKTYTRTSVFARVRLSPFDEGQVLPHEYTMSAPKEDRRLLMAATRANVSPIFSLVPDSDGAFRNSLIAAAGTLVADADDILGVHHQLEVLADPSDADRLQNIVARRTLFIADGHHRYETALTYRDEMRNRAGSWSGEEPENFILMAIAAIEDPGLLILPIHRLLKGGVHPRDLEGTAGPVFHFTDLGPIGSITPAALTEQLAEAGADTNAYVFVDGKAGRISLATLVNRTAVAVMMPEGHPLAWQALDVNVLQFGLLAPHFGIDNAALTAGAVEYSEDAAEALTAVTAGHVHAAFLVNATTGADIIAVAGAGDRMPQKSTYFYPKLGTGLVLHAHDIT